MDNTGTWYTKTRVNDDFTVNKKKNKNKNYNNNTNTQSNTNEKSSPQEPKKSVTNPTALLSMFPTFDKETILDIYEHNGKNFDKTVQILKDLTADAEQPSPLKSDSPGSDGPTPFRYESTPGDFVESPGKRDYDMLQEHDDLCDQVSEILDSAFDRSDIGEDDIQELLLMCEENVCFVIEEEQKLREPKNEEYEADQITKEVQEFILRAIQNEQKSTKVNTSLSNFPSLNSSNWKEESYTSTTPFAKIVNKEHNKKQMKIQPNVPDKWGNEPNNQIHSGNKAGSTREIIQLCKHFPSLPLNEIKTVYSLLDEDYEFSLNFLKEKRRKAYQSIPLMKPKTVKKVVRVVNNQGGYEEPKVRHDETVEAILKDYTYQEIRENVQRLTRIKCILDRTATQARGSRKYNEVARIEGAALGQTHQLDKFSKASKKYVLDKARKNKEFYAMDLHGLYWDEAREVVIEQINYLSKIADGSRGQFSYIDRIKNGQKCMEYAIITGKGLNSRNNVPVLYNGLCNFLKEKHLAYTPLLNEGRVVVYIPM